MSKPLNARISNALATNRIGHADLEALIAETITERDRQVALHQSSGAESMNFALEDADRDAAALDAARAGRNATALTAALQQLDDKLVTIKADEKTQEKEAQRKAALAERDALAERIRTEWPSLIDGIVDLLRATVDNDERLRSLGLNEASAECIARGIPANFYRGNVPLTRLTKIRLPNFEGDRLLWPSAAPPVVHVTPVATKATATAATTEMAFYTVSHRSDDGVRFYSANPIRPRTLYHVPIGCWLTTTEAERLKGIGVTVTKMQAPESEAA